MGVHGKAGEILQITHTDASLAVNTAICSNMTHVWWKAESQRPDLNALNLLDEPVADRLQSISSPRMEPVDGGALDKGRESTGPYTKDIAHRRQTQDHLQIRNQRHKESPHKNTYCIA